MPPEVTRTPPGRGLPQALPLPWYRQLYMQVLVATLLGILLGAFAPGLGAQMKPLGDGFIALIRMLIAPIIFCTVVHGIARMGDMRRVGRVALKAILYFEAITTLALLVAVVMIHLWPVGVGMNIHADALDTSAIRGFTAPAQHQDVVGFITHIIPSTFIDAFAQGNILQVLFLAVLFAFGLSAVGPRGQPVLAVIDAASEVFFAIVGLIMKLAPLGAFGAIAFTVGRYGAGSLLSLGKLLAEFYITCAIFILCVLGPVARLAGFRILHLVRYLRDEILVILATTSSETVLPQMMRKMTAAGCEESVVGLVIPTGYSFNLDGTCLYLATAALFLAQATNTPMGLAQQLGLIAVLLLTSKGAAGVAGAAFVVLAATLSTMNSIPVSAIALVLGIHRFMSMGLTLTNVIGNGVATIVVARWEGALDRDQLQRVLAARD